MKDEHPEAVWLCSDPSLQRTQGCCCTELLQISYWPLWLKDVHLNVQGAVPPASGARSCKDTVESLWKFSYVEIFRCTGNVTPRQYEGLSCIVVKLRQTRRAWQLSSSASLLMGPSVDWEGRLSVRRGEDALCFSAFWCEVSSVQQVPESVAGGKSKFSCLCCGADVRRIYPAFVRGDWPLFERQWPRRCWGREQRETGARLLNGPSRRPDGGVSWWNKSKAAASTLLKEEGQDNAPGPARELPVRVPWSQQGLATTSVPREKGRSPPLKRGEWEDARLLSLSIKRVKSQWWLALPSYLPGRFCGFSDELSRFSLDKRVPGKLLGSLLHHLHWSKSCASMDMLCFVRNLGFCSKGKIVFVNDQGWLEKASLQVEWLVSHCSTWVAMATARQAWGARGEQTTPFWGRGVQARCQGKAPTWLPAWSSKVPNTTLGCHILWPAQPFINMLLEQNPSFWRHQDIFFCPGDGVSHACH